MTNNFYDNNSSSKNVKIILVPKYMNEDELKKANIYPTATVEAEYGENVIKGTLITLAHHAKEYVNNNAPCNTPNVPVLDDNSIIIISHIDLDTLGGISALLGIKKGDSKFWKAAEFLDLNGPHNLSKVDDEEVRKKYIAYQAFHANHTIPRLVQITDVTDIVLEHLDAIDQIIDGDKELIEQGIAWDKKIKEEIEKCLVKENENVRVFYSQNGVCCSAAYYSEKQGKVIPSIVVMDEITKTVVVAMADGGKRISAKELVQKLWGDKAGGHQGIAGSPRGEEMTIKDMMQMANLVNKEINKVKNKSESNRSDSYFFESEGFSLGD